MLIFTNLIKETNEDKEKRKQNDNEKIKQITVLMVQQRPGGFGFHSS